jgi:hypothetical protein
MRLLYLSSKDAISGNAGDFEVPLVHTLSVAEGGRFDLHSSLLKPKLEDVVYDG